MVVSQRQNRRRMRPTEYSEKTLSGIGELGFFRQTYARPRVGLCPTSAAREAAWV